MSHLSFRSCIVATCARTSLSSQLIDSTLVRCQGRDGKISSSIHTSILLWNSSNTEHSDYLAFPRRSFGTTTNPKDNGKAKLAMRNKREARKVSLKKKEAALETLLQNSSSTTNHQDAATKIDNNTDSVSKSKKYDGYSINKEAQHQNKDDLEKLRKERNELLNEAQLMTLSLYRTCLRCVRLMRPGNTHDHQQFDKREQDQFEDMERLNIGVGSKEKNGPGRLRGGGSSTFSFEPPVDRENELRSRAFYYLAHVQESFGQEMDCLAKDPWIEGDTQRFVHLIRYGEERRRWILADYKFDDPYRESFNEERLDKFDLKAKNFMKKVYKQKGWLLSSDAAVTDNRKDSAWDDDEEEDTESDLL